MPQIDQIATTYASQAFWLLLVFAIIYFGIAKGMLGKVGQTVTSRANSIAADLKAAEDARAAAASAQDAYTKALDTSRAAAAKATSDAKSAAAKDMATKLAAVDANLAAKIEAADSAIAAAKAKALSDVDSVAAETAAALVGKLTGGSVDLADAQAALAALRS
jgi:F-type H+-transporting ATPase subunit b